MNWLICRMADAKMTCDSLPERTGIIRGGGYKIRVGPMLILDARISLWYRFRRDVKENQ